MRAIMSFTSGVIVLGITAAAGRGAPPALAAAGAAPVASAVQTTTPAERFAGAWSLMRIERRNADGELVGSPIEDRIGYIIYDGDEHMGVTIMQPDREPFAGDEPTPEEALAAVSTYTSYFGRYTVNDAEGYVTHHLEGSLNPSGAGSDYQRFFRFEDDQLILQPPANDEGVTTELTWQRLPDLPDAELTDTHRRLFGVYRIESVSRTADGEPIEVDQYDTAYIMYAPSGHMSVHLMRPGREPYAAGTPTPEEALAATRTYGSYFGPFSVHEAEGYLVHHRIGNENPGGTDTDAQRFYELTDTHLTLRPPAGTDEQGRTVQTALRWARITE